LPESYIFTTDLNPVEVNVTYKFQTTSGHTYAVTFIEVTKVIEVFDEFQTISNAIHVIVDPVNINGPLGFDARIGATVTSIIKDYLANIGDDQILIFICDSKDGKQIKRDSKFERWYSYYKSDTSLEKINQEILEPQDNGTYLSTFISILFSSDHPRRENILNEIKQLKESFGLGKFGEDENS